MVHLRFEWLVNSPLYMFYRKTIWLVGQLVDSTFVLPLFPLVCPVCVFVNLVI